MFFYILKFGFIAKADHSNFSWQKQINPHFIFYMSLKKKHSFNLCDLLRWQCWCLANIVVVVIINCMDVITRNTQSFSLTIVTCCFCKAPWKRFSFYFTFFALKKISQVHQVCRNYLSSITFSQLWWNSSQLARLFKVKVALYLNTAHWFTKMALSASVQKQQGRLLASAVKRELAMPWKSTIPAFLTKRF